MSLKIAFLGTPEFSVPSLKALLDAGHEIVAVYTRPPRPSGRGKKTKPSEIALFAQKNKILVYAPKSFKDEADISCFQNLNMDLAVVVAYGLILPKRILKAPKHGCINVHASLLPRWRGAAPIQRAIMAGDKTTGITIMQMDEGLDTGPILSKKEIKIEASDTSQSLHNKLSKMGGACLIPVLKSIENGTIPDKAQAQAQDGVTYATKIEKGEAQINWLDSAIQIDRKIRGLSPFPGAWFSVGRERVKILDGHVSEINGTPGTTLDDDLTIACGTGSYKVLKAQKAGKKPMKASDLLRGFPILKGTPLDKAP